MPAETNALLPVSYACWRQSQRHPALPAHRPSCNNCGQQVQLAQLSCTTLCPMPFPRPRSGASAVHHAPGMRRKGRDTEGAERARWQPGNSTTNGAWRGQTAQRRCRGTYCSVTTMVCHLHILGQPIRHCSCVSKSGRAGATRPLPVWLELKAPMHALFLPVIEDHLFWKRILCEDHLAQLTLTRSRRQQPPASINAYVTAVCMTKEQGRPSYPLGHPKLIILG